MLHYRTLWDYAPSHDGHARETAVGMPEFMRFKCFLGKPTGVHETLQQHVRRLRPDLAWEDVLRTINGPLPEARQWTQSRLPSSSPSKVRIPTADNSLAGQNPL